MIIRKLNNAIWVYDEDDQQLYLQVTTPAGTVQEINLNRTYAFSLARFLIRVFFRMSMKKRKKGEETPLPVEPSEKPGTPLRFG